MNSIDKYRYLNFLKIMRSSKGLGRLGLMDPSPGTPLRPKVLSGSSPSKPQLYDKVINFVNVNFLEKICSRSSGDSVNFLSTKLLILITAEQVHNSGPLSHPRPSEV